jgi:hypothetical protein
MISSASNNEAAIRAKSVSVTDDRITVKLTDGRAVSIPTKWYPRLLHATASERDKVEIWDDGIIWPRINADLSYHGMFSGLKSGESPQSLRRWLKHRARGERDSIPTLPLPPNLAKILSRKKNKKKTAGRSLHAGA